ncbi:MAG: PEP-CTERM sorting domain-containing protein [Planctomycetes bacterium]|nr:PEP-CTERM sorting domain-containing protein [Planctomycetota bacterium]
MRTVHFCMTVVTVAVLMMSFATTTARADWDPVYDSTGKIINHKMHYPQLPDPQGWDVNATWPKVLADDWKCSQTGPVNDIHFWGSWRYDQQYPISSIRVSIHSDIPATPDQHSRPGELLWARDFLPGEFSYRPWGTGPQGWYDPNTGEYYRPDHFGIWQYNIVDIPQPFYQELGKIYWLDISVRLPAGVPPWWGWKTSRDHFNDDAVWTDYGLPTLPWRELRDPIMQESLDLAFVITPEPAGLLMLAGLGGLALLRRRR